MSDVDDSTRILNPSDEEERVRVVRWTDPLALARAFLSRDGLDAVRAQLDGKLPTAPIYPLLGLKLVDAEPGFVVISIVPAEYHFNQIGAVHGGITATLLDSVMGVAITTRLPQGTGFTTLQINVNYTRPITLASGELRAEGRVVHLGRRTATAESTVKDADGRLCAHGTATCLILAGTAS